MYSSPSSSSDSDDSSGSYGRRLNGLSRSHRSKSKSRKGLHPMFDDDTTRNPEGARELSRLLTKHGLHLSDEKPRSHRKKHFSRETDAAVSRKELNEIKRQHEKEVKNLLKFLEKESSLLNGIEEEKREELHKLKRQHEKEVKKLVEVLEKEVVVVTEQHTAKQADLEERLEKSQFEAHKEMSRCKERSRILEEEVKSLSQELESTEQKSKYKMRKLMDELDTSVRQTSSLEDEGIMLREKLGEKDQELQSTNHEIRKLVDELGMSERQTSSLENEVILLRKKLGGRDLQIRQFEENERELQKQKSKYEIRKMTDELGMSERRTSSLEGEVTLLREKLVEKDEQIRQFGGVKSSHEKEEMRDEIRSRDDELRRKDRALMRKNEEIRLLNSKPAPTQVQVENLDINGDEWEETSGLTSSSDFDLRKVTLEVFREKPSMKYGFSPDQGRKTSHSTSVRGENRDDLDTRRLTVSFSDEVEKRNLPMQMHDNLSRRLEKMYVDK